MSRLKLTERYRTIKGLHSIFSALQVVTVVRTQRIKEKYSSIDRYLSPMREVLRGRLEERKTKRKVLVLITSNRGLCGAFNSSATALALEKLRQEECQIVAVGKMGAEALRRRGFSPSLVDLETTEKPSFTSAAKTFNQILALQGEIRVVFNSYRSSLVQIPKMINLSPLPDELKARSMNENFILEPEEKELTRRLFSHYLANRFYQIILESSMGELGARLMVLKGAVDSSNEMAGDLNLAINKARQADITRDLLEIVSAAEALRRDYE